MQCRPGRGNIVVQNRNVRALASVGVDKVGVDHGDTDDRVRSLGRVTCWPTSGLWHGLWRGLWRGPWRGVASLERGIFWGSGLVRRKIRGKIGGLVCLGLARLAS